MNIRRTLTLSVTAAIVVAFIGVTSAGTISINFVGGSNQCGWPSPMGPSEVAGMQYVADDHWNNAPGRAGTLSNLTDGTGADTGAGFAWMAGIGTWSIPVADNPGNDRMMKGYLDANDVSRTTVMVGGLAAAFSQLPYDVYAYFDGDNTYHHPYSGTHWRIAEFTIGCGGQNPYGYFQLPTPGGTGNLPFLAPPPGRIPNNNEGNYQVFTGLTGDGFTLTAHGGPRQGDLARGPLNGIQIVPIPEPSSLVLLSMGAVGLLAYAWRRQKGA